MPETPKTWLLGVDADKERFDLCAELMCGKLRLFVTQLSFAFSSDLFQIETKTGIPGNNIKRCGFLEG